MTEQEYRKALHEIRVKAEKERVMLARKFATEHSPVKVGDYISDNLYVTPPILTLKCRSPSSSISANGLFLKVSLIRENLSSIISLVL